MKLKLQDKEVKDSSPGMHIDSATMRSTPETPLDTTDDDMDETWDIDADLTNAIDKYGTKIQCMTEDCDKKSVAVWASSLNDDPWYTCEACQEVEFAGWPEDFEFECHDNDDEKTNVITIEKDDITSEKGSTDLPVTTSASSHVSPKDNSLRSDRIDSIPCSITPSPVEKRKLDVNCHITLEKDQLSVKPLVTPVPFKLSQKALATHKKLQDAADALNGGRIIVNKPQAKEKVFNLLNDSFVPMCITDIYKKLKGVVPSQILKSCLDDMCNKATDCNLFAESDEEDTPSLTTSKFSDKYYEALRIKAGRNTSNTLYYVNYNKAISHGNGLLPEDRNELLSKHDQVKAKNFEISESLQYIIDETEKLLSEPTNTEAVANLAVVENAVDVLQDKVQTARKLKVNESHRNKVESQIKKMKEHWKKRKRICMDFIFNMDDLSDGVITSKKCFSGDVSGFELDSDEAIIKVALKYEIKKRGLGLGLKKTAGKRAQNVCGNNNHDNSFVAVRLNKGNIERVYKEQSD